jgi:ATP-binding cassette, subfamily B, bacterial
MKILLNYLKPYKWLVGLTLFLAFLNTGFSLMDPIILGKIVNLSNDYVQAGHLHRIFLLINFSTLFPGKTPG